MKNSSSHLPLHPNTHPPPPSDDDEPSRREWDFNLSAVISSTATSSSDAISAVEFDPTNSLLATGGIARKIRLYTAAKLIPPTKINNDDNTPATAFLDHAATCEFYIYTPARLSSLKWKPGSGSKIIGSGDYDGVVMEYDLEKRVPVFELDEHDGKRVWSVDYSVPTGLGASGSDDGTMQMWDARTGGTVSRVDPARNPICSVEFDQFGPGHVVAAGCADRRVYGYDVRKTGVGPVFVLDGHERAVANTRFVDRETMVSSSVDGCLIMWDVGERRAVRVYKGHVNRRRFVGLSVWRKGGLLSCGSENNRVFVYDKRWGEPIWVEPEGLREDGRFVSGVCWRQTEEEGRCTLVAGGSDGVLQVFEGQRKSCL